MFKKDIPDMPQERIAVTIISAVEFREDIDLNEQQRFRKRIQRKFDEHDVVTLQDIKDVVLYTAPPKIVQPIMINLLHLPATERFLRALIFYCQYFLQTSDLMNQRTLELNTKIRTPESDKTETILLENLEDLRLLVAKEYSNVILGLGEFTKFHHMGASKKSRSLSKRDSLLFETFFRISIQIIWIALGRKSFSQIELEVNRIFKSTVFNSAEHKMSKDNKANLTAMNPNERMVQLGHCMLKRHKVNELSPLMNEVHCNRYINHRMYGLGVIKYPCLSERHRYLEAVLSLPETMLDDEDMSIGILGLPRKNFDILLKQLKSASPTSSSISFHKQSSKSSNMSKIPTRKSALLTGPLYREIMIPPRNHAEESMQPCLNFPTETIPRRPCDEIQHKKWIKRVQRLKFRQRHHIHISTTSSRLADY
ncbi:unnamed protein product [Chrysodeixis includens]|nr:unnamed protein product [Chrysodeixis includens]